MARRIQATLLAIALGGGDAFDQSGLDVVTSRPVVGTRSVVRIGGLVRMGVGIHRSARKGIGQQVTLTNETAGVQGGATLLKTLIGAAVGIVCLWLAFRQIPMKDIVRFLSVVRPVPMAVAIIAIIFATLTRAWRWKLLFPAGDRAIRFGKLWPILVVGQMLNIIAPTRLGDLYRLYLVERTESRSMPETLGTIGIEKAFDAVVFIVLILVASFQASLPANLNDARGPAVLASVGLLAGLGVLIIVGMRALRTIERGGFLSSRVARRLIERWIRPLLHGLTAPRDPRRLFTILLFSFLTWSASWLANYACFAALNIAQSATAALVVMVVLLLGTAVTSSPGNLGLFEYLCVLALGAFQVPRTEALSYAILLHAVAYVPPVVIGAVIFLFNVMPRSLTIVKSR